jgi:hypothetical protein
MHFSRRSWTARRGARLADLLFPALGKRICATVSTIPTSQGQKSTQKTDLSIFGCFAARLIEHVLALVPEAGKLVCNNEVLEGELAFLVSGIDRKD